MSEKQAGSEVTATVSDTVVKDEAACGNIVVVHDDYEDLVEEVVEEEMVVIQDHQMRADDDMDSDESDIPPPSAMFLNLFESITEYADPNNTEHLEKLFSAAWKQYYESSQHVVLEECSNVWVSCAVYCTMVQRRARFPAMSYPFKLSDILKVCGVSVIEFFDKLDRWIDIISGSKRMRDHAQRLQSSLAVSAVVYKKMVPMFRRLFLLVETPTNTNIAISSNQLLQLVWSMFLVMKKSLPSEDLISCFHLMLCLMETVYDEICVLELEEHINNEFAQQLIDSCEGVLEFMCRSFEGVLLDAKHFRIHWYNSRKSQILQLSDPSDAVRRHEQHFMYLNALYESKMLRRGEMDERMFLPKDASSVFDTAFDCSAVQVLRRARDDSTFADAELLLRMSTQTCLEKLADHNKPQPTPLTSKSYIISTDSLVPLTPLSASLENPSKLAALVPSDWTLQGSLLEQCCMEMRDNPLPTIALSAEHYGQRFADRVHEETNQRGEHYDSRIGGAVDKHHQMVINVFYVLMEKIAKSERARNPGRDLDFCNVFRKDEFLASVFACAIELVLFSYGSERQFPWSVRLFELAPISFHKVIEVIIRAEPGLSREMVKHLNRKEEEVLENLAWSTDSPIWVSMARRADCVPSCDQAWNQPRQLSSSYSPMKRRKLEDGSCSPAPSTGSNSTSMFFRKVYYVACVRLSDLCDRIRMDERGRKMAWTTLEHVLRTETSLLAGRHLDQNLLCIIYVVARSLKMSCTFMDIVSHYRHQPQSRSAVYREVSIDPALTAGCASSDDGNSRDSSSGHPKLRCTSVVPPTRESPVNESDSTGGAAASDGSSADKVDLIRYYNLVFLPRMKEYMRRLDSSSADDSTVRLIPMPIPRGFGLSPVKRTIADRVSIVPLTTSQQIVDRQYKYNIQNSPRKDLQMINRMVNVAGQAPFYSVAEVPNKANAFGPLYRR